MSQAVLVRHLAPLPAKNQQPSSQGNSLADEDCAVTNLGRKLRLPNEAAYRTLF